MRSKVAEGAESTTRTIVPSSEMPLTMAMWPRAMPKLNSVPSRMRLAIAVSLLIRSLLVVKPKSRAAVLMSRVLLVPSSGIRQ